MEINFIKKQKQNDEKSNFYKMSQKKEEVKDE